MFPRSSSHRWAPTARLLLALAPVLALLLSAAPASALNGRQLAAAMAKREAKMGAHAGALVQDLSTGRTLYSRNRTTALSPASNEKLYTTASALLKWGPKARLTTQVRARPSAGPDAKGVLRGDLVIVGAGDPSFGDTALRNITNDLRRLGVRHITGHVLGDEQEFDTRRGSYATGFAPDSELGGWLGGLVWGHGRVGAHGPAQYAAARLTAILESKGVKVDGVAHTGGSAKGTRVVAAASSPTMAELSAILLVPSDNFYAEMLVKGLGARFGGGGTTADGTHVVRATLASAFGIHPRVVDGSGLSASNRTSPAQIVRVLAGMARKKVGATWRAGFPTPGRTGTLAGRMRGTAAVNRCKAKTGTLHDVSALSGYCKVPGGHLIGFSFLENRVDPYTAKALEDQMIPIIARYSPPS